MGMDWITSMVNWKKAMEEPDPDKRARKVETVAYMEHAQRERERRMEDARRQMNEQHERMAREQRERLQKQQQELWGGRK